MHLGYRRKSLLFLFLQFRFNGLLEPLKASLIEQLSVDENSRSTGNIRLTAVVDIPINERSDGRVFAVLVELLHVQTYFHGDRLHFGIAQIALVGEQFFMEFPKLALLPGCECSDGCLPCIIVYLIKWIVFNNKLHFIRVLLQHLPEEGSSPAQYGHW